MITDKERVTGINDDLVGYLYEVGSNKIKSRIQRLEKH